jgi:hypothetical protein
MDSLFDFDKKWEHCTGMEEQKKQFPRTVGGQQVRPDRVTQILYHTKREGIESVERSRHVLDGGRDAFQASRKDVRAYPNKIRRADTIRCFSWFLFLLDFD